MKRKKTPVKKSARATKRKPTKPKKPVGRKKKTASKARVKAPRKKRPKQAEPGEYESTVVPFLADLKKEGIDVKPYAKCRDFFAVLHVMFQETHDEDAIREVITGGLQFIQPKFDFTPYVEALLVAVKTNDAKSYDEINELAILKAFGA